MQQMRLSDVLFLFFFPPSDSRFSKHLGILDSRSYIPITRLSQGIRFILCCLAVSSMFMFIPPSPHPIYSPLTPISHLPHYIPSQSPYTPHYTHFTYFMTPPLLSFCLCLGSSLLLCLWFFRSNDVCPAHPEVYYAAIASVVHLLALSALRVLITTAGTIVFIVLDTTIAMLLLLDLSTPHKMASFEYGKIHINGCLYTKGASLF